MKQFYVYIMSNIKKTLYIGLTNDLERRINEHKSGNADSFTKKYAITKLVYFYTLDSSNEAISLEKKLKGITRDKKIQLIQENNPSWRDLSVVSI